MLEHMFHIPELHPVSIFIEGAIFFLGWKLAEVIVDLICVGVVACFGERQIKVGFKKDE